MKLDYGLCNSVRISDHTGKKHLKYRYNIGPHIRKSHKERDKFDRFYFQSSDVDSLLDQIIADKEEKIEKYTPEGYMTFMKVNKEEHAGEKGFWKNAVILNEQSDCLFCGQPRLSVRVSTGRHCPYCGRKM